VHDSTIRRHFVCVSVESLWVGHNGKMIPAACAIRSNQLEDFAELSAMYFVGGNYHPFDGAGLTQHDPVRTPWGCRRAKVAPMPAPQIDRDAIAQTYDVIRPFIRRTPVIEVDGADFGLSDCRVVLKLELLQHAGAFKTRGAFANLLLREIPEAGVVAASGGNHGAAVAFAAKRLGKPARIYVPTISSPAKVARIRECGVELCITGDRYADALAASQAWALSSGALQVHAFDQAETLLGQGSVALEIEQQSARIDTLLVGVGGGGLIGGIAAWCAGRVRVIGVEPELSPTLTRALEAGRPVPAEAGGIAADSLAPKQVGDLVFPIARRYVDRVLLVSDVEIRAAQQKLWDSLRVVAEPGGAAVFGALIAGRYQPSAGERVGVVISGGNTTAVDFSR
jgi:threonine dehydratase